MKVEVAIDRTKKLPNGAIPALQEELYKRLSQTYENCSLTIRLAGSDSLFVTGVEHNDKKIIEQFLQDTGESADDWFEGH